MLKYSRAMSLDLHLTDYTDGTFVTPIRTYGWRVYVLDDDTTMDDTTRHIATDRMSSKLLYFVKGDDDGGEGFALHGDRGPSGAKGLKGDSGDRDVAGSRGPTGKRGAAGPGGPPGKLVKLEHVVELEHVVNRVTRETLAVLVSKDIEVHKEVRAHRIVEEPLVKLDPKWDKGDPAVDIDIDLCKHLPVEMVEQYRRGVARCYSRQDYY